MTGTIDRERGEGGMRDGLLELVAMGGPAAGRAAGAWEPEAVPFAGFAGLAVCEDGDDDDDEFDEDEMFGDDDDYAEDEGSEEDDDSFLEDDDEFEEEGDGDGDDEDDDDF